MLRDLTLKKLKPREKPYKVSDRDGMYVTFSPAGTITFRFDYRISERRETLTLGVFAMFSQVRSTQDRSEGASASGSLGRAVMPIAVTGWGQQADNPRALAAAFNHHFTKPIEPDQLSQLLRADARIE